MAAKVDGRIARLEVYLEPQLLVVAGEAAKKDGRKVSSYVRGLIIADIKQKDLLTEGLLLDLAQAS